MLAPDILPTLAEQAGVDLSEICRSVEKPRH